MISGKLHNDAFDIQTRTRFLKYSGHKVPTFEARNAQTVSKLISLIDHENIITATREELCSVLEILPNNLNRRLKALKGIVRFYTHWHPHPEHDVPVGWVRIEISPAYGWRESDRISRERAVRLFYATEELGGPDSIANHDPYASAPYRDAFGSLI